jgi:SAM-dependent methyltransferase
MNKPTKAWKDDNDDFLDYLLQEAKEVPKIKAYLLAEEAYLQNNIPIGVSVMDFGCGNGRHLNLLKNRIGRGVGIDMNQSYLDKASFLCNSKIINFEVANIENYSPKELFDVVFSLYNTFGNIENQRGMINSRRKSLKPKGKALISVFSVESIAPRLELYKIMGFDNLDIDGHTIMTEEGFISKCFTKDELRSLAPNAKIEKLTDIGWMVVIEKEEKK